MIARLLTGALVFVTAACATPVEEAAMPETWACRDVVLGAAVQAYALARFRDDQRAVILLPSGEAAAAYEAETKRLRDEAARLMSVLSANDPEAETRPQPSPVSPAAMTDEKVAADIAAADACVAGAGK